MSNKSVNNKMYTSQIKSKMLMQKAIENSNSMYQIIDGMKEVIRG